MCLRMSENIKQEFFDAYVSSRTFLYEVKGLPTKQCKQM